MKKQLIFVALTLISFVTFAQQKTSTVNAGFWKVKMGQAPSFVDASQTFITKFLLSQNNFNTFVKDVNDAVIALGRVGTLLTIMAARETSKIKIELRKKQLVKRIRT